MTNAAKQSSTESWLKFLNPEELRSNLLSASLYLAAYEILKSSIIDQIESFYISGWSANSGFLVDEEYKRKVLALDKSPLRASALWLQQHSVIATEDLEKLDRVRKHRNDIAHDLPKFVSNVETQIEKDLFQLICDLVVKIDLWWIREVEIPTNPELDPREIDFDGIQSGNMIFLYLLVNIATGKTDEADFYYRKFQEHLAAQPQTSK